MAEIILFEDQPKYVDLVKRCLDKGGHVLVGHSPTIQGAFDLLRDVISGELVADFMLVDGTLSDTDGTVQPIFRYTHPVQDELPGYFRGLLRRQETPRETVVEVNPRLEQRHGRAIVEIVNRLELPIKTIGFSGDPMLDIEVDVDVPDKDPELINRVIAHLEQEAITKTYRH